MRKTWFLPVAAGDALIVFRFAPPALADESKDWLEAALVEIASEDTAVHMHGVQSLFRMDRSRGRLVSDAERRNLPECVRDVLWEVERLPSLASLECVEVAWKGVGPGSANGVRHSLLVAEKADFGQGFASLADGRELFHLVEVVGPERVRVLPTKGFSVVDEDGAVRTVKDPIEIGTNPVRFRWCQKGGGVDVLMRVIDDYECCLLPLTDSRTEKAEIRLFDREGDFVSLAYETWARTIYPRPAPPHVSFKRYRVATNAWGVKPCTSYRAYLSSTDTSSAGTRIEVLTRDHGFRGDALVHPMVAVAIPRSGPVHVHVTGDRYRLEPYYTDFAERTADGLRVTVQAGR